MISRRAKIAAGLALSVAVAMRVWNAFAYNLLWGFDAKFNWEYIEYLTLTWTLPHPESLWSAAHPPLFYYLGAAVVRALGSASPATGVIVLRLIGTAFGLATVGLAYALVRRLDPQRPRRALVAAGLLLFLPVHIYMSAMVTEEILATFLISAVLFGLACARFDPERPGRDLYVPLVLGVLAGLAFLTKLTGVLVAVAAVATLLLEGWRRRTPGAALERAVLFAIPVAVVGGWFYVRSLLLYGYLYPSGLEVHQMMFTMQPGVRHVADYFYLPLAIWTDPQVLDRDLLRSVWGSTFVTMWFDGQRAFLPHSVPAVDRVGAVILALALVPMAAFAVGVGRGIRRAVGSAGGPDLLFLTTLALTLAGYVLFTWRNPFFAVLKASFLLSLALPFAWYASEGLEGWLARGGAVARIVSVALIAGALLVCATFTHTRLFWNTDHMDRPGMVWATWDPATGEVLHR